MNKKALVVGVSGITGNNVAKKLIEQGWKTYGLARNPEKSNVKGLNPVAADLLDFDRMLSQGPIVIEWAEKVKGVLPESYLWITLKYTGMEHRAMRLTSQGKRHEKIIDQLRRKLYGDF